VSDDLDFMPASNPKGEPKPAGEAKAPAVKPSASKSAEPAKPAEPASAAEPGAASPAEGERVELPTWNRARRKRQANATAQEQSDAFQRGVRAAGRQVIDFPKLVIGALVIGVATIAAVVLLGQRNAAADAESSRVLAGATAAIVRGQVLPPEQVVGQEEWIAKLRFPIHTDQAEHDTQIATNLDAALAVESDAVALDARLVAAAQQVRLGEFAAALPLYDEFLAEAPADHPLRFLALEGKGIAQEAQDDFEGALASFQAIAPREGDFYRHMALYHQGRVLESLDRKDEALAVYEQFFVEFPKPVLPTSNIRERVEALDPELAARLASELGQQQPTLELPPELGVP
jgi:hypothetical protein